MLVVKMVYLLHDEGDVVLPDGCTVGDEGGDVVLHLAKADLMQAELLEVVLDRHMDDGIIDALLLDFRPKRDLHIEAFRLEGLCYYRSKSLPKELTGPVYRDWCNPEPLRDLLWRDLFLEYHLQHLDALLLHLQFGPRGIRLVDEEGIAERDAAQVGLLPAASVAPLPSQLLQLVNDALLGD